MLSSIISLIAGPVAAVVGEWQGRKRVREESAARIEEAKVNAEIVRIQKETDAEITWDNLWAKQAETSWKDEWFTILLSFPMIIAFADCTRLVLSGEDAMASLERAFAIMDVAPEWFIAFLGAAVAASFGIRALANLRSRK